MGNTCAHRAGEGHWGEPRATSQRLWLLWGALLRGSKVARCGVPCRGVLG